MKLLLSSLLVLSLLSCASVYEEGFRDEEINPVAEIPEYDVNLGPVVIFPFTNESSFDFPNYEKLVGRYVQIGITNSGVFNVVSREQIENITDEIKLQSTGLTDQDTMLEVGNLLNAEYAISGSIIQYSAKSSSVRYRAGLINKTLLLGGAGGVEVNEGVIKVEISLNIIDLETGRIMKYFVGESEYITKSFSSDMEAFNLLYSAITGQYAGISAEVINKFDESIVGLSTKRAVYNGLGKLLDYVTANGLED